jgi:hypothetical protein
MVSSEEPHGVTTQKTPFFIVTAVKTSNLTSTNEIKETHDLKFSGEERILT